MKVVKGNKIIDLNTAETKQIFSNFSRFVVDLGTGDGRLIYEKSIEDPETLYVGIDPSQKQLQIYSKKAQKEKRTNTLFIIGSLELLPSELSALADKLFIILPWGSLLEAIVRPSQETILKINNLMRNNGVLTIVLGYAHENEPAETKRLNLPEIDIEYIKKEILPPFSSAGLVLNEISQVQKDELKTLKTSWGKKLTFGKDRPIFKIVLQKS